MIEEGQFRTPVRLNVTQAAKAVGRARSTVNRDIDNGKVSVTRNAKGQPFIDIAELERVYGSVDIGTVTNPAKVGQETATETVSLGHIQTPKNDNSDSQLGREIEVLLERLSSVEAERTRLEAERTRERQQLTDQIEDLRRRLDQSDQERRDKDRQLTAVLTDQRPKDEAPQPNAGRGFWARFRRRA